MNQKIITALLLIGVVIIVFIVLKPTEEKTYSSEDIANISKALEDKFEQIGTQRHIGDKFKLDNPHSKTIIDSSQGIIGVIYKKNNTTWFFKAKDSKQKVDSITKDFKMYFIDQLKFDVNEQPILSHIPELMRAKNTSRMREATFRINEVEVSVSQLSGQQDVYANVRRWMTQIGLTNSSKINLNFMDDKKTIFVKMPR